MLHKRSVPLTPFYTGGDRGVKLLSAVVQQTRNNQQILRVLALLVRSQCHLPDEELGLSNPPPLINLSEGTETLVTFPRAGSGNG